MTNIRNIAVALSAIVLTAGSSFAAPVSPVNTVKTEEPSAEPVSVNFIGEDADYLYFRVTVKKGSNKVVELSVSDLFEGELFSTVYATDKVQTLKIEKRFDQQLDFTVKAGRKNYSRTYTIMPTVVLEKL